MKNHVISVIGLGFVGLSLAVVNARKGIETIGVDNNTQKISSLKNGKVDFFEPDLQTSLKKAIDSKKIIFTDNTHDAVINSNITFVTVGTPPKKSGGVDLKFLQSSLNQISQTLKNKKSYHLLVIKSTLPPLTTKKIIFPIFEKLIKKKKMDIVVNPEFLREGFALQDLLKPHLIVVGSQNKKGGEVLEKYYKRFYSKLPEIIQTDLTSAELIKYANNAFLATKISFINTIANICQKIPESDVNQIANAIGKDVRIGPLFLKAGPGFGGSCLPKDLSGLINFSKQIKEDGKFFEAVKSVNTEQPNKILEIMKEMNVLSKTNEVAILGVSFKKDTDDIREAMSIKLVQKLLKKGLRIKVHDPMAINNFKKIFGDKIIYSKSISDCIEKTDCCILLTEWKQYQKLNPKKFEKMKKMNIIDARRVLDPRKFENVNFRAIGLGSNKIKYR